MYCGVGSLIKFIIYTYDFFGVLTKCVKHETQNKKQQNDDNNIKMYEEYFCERILFCKNEQQQLANKNRNPSYEFVLALPQ